MAKGALTRLSQSDMIKYSHRFVLKDAVTGSWWDCAINFSHKTADYLLLSICEGRYFF